jgi:D-arabinose 1-dehydrogenase-like Zn-dependent alcohol dehydrogenase
MATMRAARFDTTTRELTVTAVPVPGPGPGEVRVRVRACGICLSDVHLLDGSLQSSLAEITPGHESAGVVDAIGSGIDGWGEGDHVVVAGGRACGRCVPCLRGDPSACRDRQIMGFDYDGAWAEHVVVPAAVLTPLPHDLPFPQAAILADAVATPYAALVERARLRPAQSVGLWGIGGLGVHAVQIARLAGAAPIVAVDPSPAARRRALKRGADHALDPAADDVPTRMRELTGGAGLDLAVDLVGANAVLAEGAASIGVGGQVLMVGLSPDRIALGPGVAFGVRAQSLLGHLGYDKHHLDQLAVLVGTGRLDVSASVTATLGLEDVHDGVRRLAEKEGDPIRLVVVP